MIVVKKYKIELKTLDPFRIGGVSDPRSGIDNPVTVVGDKLTIPGPSLKGALRSEIEKYLIDKYWKASEKKWSSDKLNFQPCIPATDYTNDEKRLIKENKYRYNVCHYPCFKKPCTSHQKTDKCENKRDKCKPEVHESHNVCPVCYFLGAMGLIGFIRVPFLFSDITPNQLYSSRIDRLTKTVVYGTNRPYQLVPDKATFIGELQIIIKDTVLGWEVGKQRPLLSEVTQGDKWLEGNTKTQDELINEYIVDRLQAITMLGGYKSKGFGQVKITVKQA